MRTRFWRETSTVGLGSARRCCGDLEWLRETDVVAKRVPQAAVDAVGSLGRLLSELDAFRPKLVVGLEAIGGRKEQVPARGAFRHHLANLLSGLRIERRGAGLLQQDLAGIAGDDRRQPPHEAPRLGGVAHV